MVLAVLAGFIVSSLLSGSGSPPQLAAPALVPSTSGDEAAPAATVPTDAVQSFTVFDGTDPTIFDSAPGNPVRFDKSNSFARITSSAANPGVRVVIGPGLSSRLSGHAVRVTLVARAAHENGATGLRFAYENGLAISPWQTANLGNDFQTFNLVWRVPSMRADPNADQLLIDPAFPATGPPLTSSRSGSTCSPSRVGKSLPLRRRGARERRAHRPCQLSGTALRAFAHPTRRADIRPGAGGRRPARRARPRSAAVVSSRMSGSSGGS